MGLFGKKKGEEQGNNNSLQNESTGAVIEPIAKNSEELKSLLDEFRDIRAGVKAQDDVEIEEEITDEYIGGEEYEVTESESESIEDFLATDDIEEELVEDDYQDIEEEAIEEEAVEEDYQDVEDDIEEEVVEDEYIEDEEVVEDNIEEEVVEDEYIEDEEVAEDEIEEDIEEETYAEESVEDFAQDAVDVDVHISVPEEVSLEEEIVDDEIDEYEDEIIEEDNVDLIEDEENNSTTASGNDNYVTSEAIDKKFDDFEKRLLDKLMAQLAVLQPAASQPVQEEVQLESKRKTTKSTEVVSDEDLVIETKNGKLTINGYTFEGEVVMFTPIESLKKATWEEVVRRKGHCTYHLTTSGNGGWFIKKSNAPNPYAYIQIKEDAVELAKFYAMREKAELKIHNNKGVIEKSLSFGREKLRG